MGEFLMMHPGLLVFVAILLIGGFVAGLAAIAGN